ncbi:replication initiation protein [Thalassobacillus sp. C254]|uniref:replication initiation protein n=1 Tax=Thalassobacillus sp. C254 TaxID=1225341 RepID=UPI0006D18378|nr:replication initiation protein [Thalassobacillus sp. C254]
MKPFHDSNEIVDLNTETNIYNHPNNLIVKSNALIEASYKLGINEHKIIRFVASKIKKTDDDFKTYRISVKEFAKSIGVKGNGYYKEIEKMSYELLKKPLKIKIDDDYIMAPWFSYIRYRDKEGIIELRFDKFFKPYLLNLKEEFTKYTFDQISELKSSYSIRIYELLKQFEGIGKREFRVEDLKDKLGCSDMYKEYSNFKLKVLKVAKKELKRKKRYSF